LSLYVETKKHKLLFDTGASGLFAINAARMNIDLSEVDLAVISHDIMITAAA
jgi:7,8-dihydropterin-6-yl-methyl-4-(beta-D-ribofuranosyl)aminobenzene 5'-phosphate synthase